MGTPISPGFMCQMGESDSAPRSILTTPLAQRLEHRYIPYVDGAIPEGRILSLVISS